MGISPRFFRWHRWLGWLVALQVLAWVAGGVVFSWLPFKAWVKAEDSVRKPEAVLPADWAAAAARHLQEQSPRAPVLAVASVATARGPALRLRHEKGESWIGAAGGALPPPDEAAVAQFARQLYKGEGRLAQVKLLPQVPVRALIVRETGGRGNLWCATFDDALATRLYFGAAAGDFVAVRNDAWVLYDFFWRLHLMDYGEGEDFNHPLIKAASLAAVLLVATGVVLSVLAVARAVRTRRRHA